MNATTQLPLTTWLRTEQQVIPVNPATWRYLPEVESALRDGVVATEDTHHQGFYEIEIGERWYYVHVPVSHQGRQARQAVYLVAAENRPATNHQKVLEHQPAC